MNRYKFHIDKPLPDSEQIKRHKDFDRLYGRYESATRLGFWRKLIRNPRTFASVVLLAVVVWLLFEVSEREQANAGPLIQPQMEVGVKFRHFGWDCYLRQLKSLEAIFARGIPLTFEENGTKYYMRADEIIERRACNFYPSHNGDTIYDGPGDWFELNMKSGSWEAYQQDTSQLDSAFLLFGKKQAWPEVSEREIRLLDSQEKNLSRQLGKKSRKALLVLPHQKTLIPLGYDGEGKHILPFLPEQGMIWTVDAQGQWWEGALDVWGNDGEIDLICKQK
jgi:hypothetical protein